MKQIKNQNEISVDLEQYIALLKRMYERMERDNSWPWIEHETDANIPCELNNAEN